MPVVSDMPIAPTDTVVGITRMVMPVSVMSPFSGVEADVRFETSGGFGVGKLRVPSS